MIFERLWKLKQKKVAETNQAEVMLKVKKASKKVRCKLQKVVDNIWRLVYNNFCVVER